MFIPYKISQLKNHDLFLNATHFLVSVIPGCDQGFKKIYRSSSLPRVKTPSSPLSLTRLESVLPFTGSHEAGNDLAWCLTSDPVSLMRRWKSSDSEGSNWQKGQRCLCVWRETRSWTGSSCVTVGLPGGGVRRWLYSCSSTGEVTPALREKKELGVPRRYISPGWCVNTNDGNFVWV